MLPEHFQKNKGLPRKSGQHRVSWTSSNLKGWLFCLPKMEWIYIYIYTLFMRYYNCLTRKMKLKGSFVIFCYCLFYTDNLNTILLKKQANRISQCFTDWRQTQFGKKQKILIFLTFSQILWAILTSRELRMKAINSRCYRNSGSTPHLMN